MDLNLKTIPDQPLFWNSLIRDENGPIGPGKWQNMVNFTDLRTVRDLFDQNGSPLSPLALRSHTRTGYPPQFLHLLLQIQKLIPQKWTESMKTADLARTPGSSLISLTIDKNPVLSMRSTEIARLIGPQISPPCEANWDEEIGPLKWKRIWSGVKDPPTNRKWNDLFFRLLHRSLPLGYRLKHFMPSAELCPLCRLHPETLQHLFLDCQVAQHLWNWSLGFHPRGTISWPKILSPSLTSSKRKAARRRDSIWTSVHRATLYAIWLTRCEVALGGETRNKDSALALLQSSLRAEASVLVARNFNHFSVFIV